MDGEIKQKSGFWKFSLKFIVIIVLAVVAGWGFARYEQYLGEKDVARMAEGFAQWEKDEYARAMADTYGGKTPQETLQMYIDAVEKGDYELASKYFIEDKRKGELNSLKNSAKEDIDNITRILKSLESVSEDTMKTKVDGYDFIVSFMKYPNSIWKITQI